MNKISIFFNGLLEAFSNMIGNIQKYIKKKVFPGEGQLERQWYQKQR